MKSRVVFPLSLLAALALGFALGTRTQVASTEEKPAETAAPEKNPATDRVVSAASSARFGAPISSEKSSCEDSDRFNLLDPKKRAAVEKFLHDVPFALLKEIFFERQDAEFEKTEDQFPAAKGLTEQEIDQRADEMMEKYRSPSSFFTGSAEWTLRGGKRAQIQAFGNVYSNSETGTGKGDDFHSVLGPATEAKKGKDICWQITVYVDIDGISGSNGTASCLGWTGVREGHPYAVLGNYGKELTPYFDSIAVPLPGFAGESDAAPQWLNSGKWSDLSRIRWNETTREEYRAREKEESARIYSAKD